MRALRLKTKFRDYSKINSQVEINGTKYNINQKWLKRLRFLKILTPLTQTEREEYLSLENKITVLEKENKQLVSYITKKLEPIKIEGGK